VPNCFSLASLVVNPVVGDDVCTVCELMSSGVFAMFVTHTVSSLSTVRSYSSTFQMPVILSRAAVNTSRLHVSPAPAKTLYSALAASPAAPTAAPGMHAHLVIH